MGLENLAPPLPARRPDKSPAVLPRKLVKYCSGKKTATHSILKKSCTIALEKARLNSAGRPTWVRDTMVLVTLVPILEPMMMGTANSMASAGLEPNAPPATSPTTREVVVEEL